MLQDHFLLSYLTTITSSDFNLCQDQAKIHCTRGGNKIQNQDNGNPIKEFLELTYIKMVVKKTLVDYQKAMKD